MTDAQFQKVSDLLRDGRMEEAQVAVSSLEASDPEDVRVWILEATVCEARGDLDSEREAIANGLRCDLRNYELYYMLGILYAYSNVNQAYLCMEQAAHYCGNAHDLAVIEDARDALRARPGFSVHGLSVIIVSYNDRELMQKNIAAVKRELPPSGGEIIVVDNHSTDGVAQWLREQRDLRLIENGDNVGFPVACNIGYMASEKENDIFLLNNDAVPAPGAMFWLRMGLYEDVNVGAVGAVSNNASTQNLKEAPHTYDACMEFGATRSVPMANPYEARCRFTGFALMVKNEAHRAVRMGKELLDSRFSPGYFEDDDLGIRIAQAGYRQLLCHNAFVYHRGGTGGFTKNTTRASASATSENMLASSKEEELARGRKNFISKWNFDIWAYEAPFDDMVDLIEEKKDAHFAVLELDAGMGVNLSLIKFRYPFSYTAGIESYPVVAGLARHMGDILCGEAEKISFPWGEKFFDYIFASDALYRARDPEAFLRKLERHLKPGGMLVYMTMDDEEKDMRMQRRMAEAGFSRLTIRGDLVSARKN